MKVLAIIPSRYNSSRFPGKPLIDINGKTMIERVYNQTQKAKLVDKVIVATDDERIFQEVKRFKGNVLMTKNTHESGTERCGEVIEQEGNYDVIINIQGDEPLIDPNQIDDVLAAFKNEDIKIATLIKELKDIDEVHNPNRVKVVLNKKSEAIYFSRNPIPFIANVPKEEWLEKAKFWKHIGIYAWRKTILEEIINLPSSLLEKQESLEQLRWLFNGYKIQTVVTTIETPNIDSPEDLEKVLEQLNR